MLREYSGNAKATTLVGALSASGTSILVADGAGYPTGATGPFVVTLAAGTSAEEKVLIDTRSGNTLTVETGGRGWDGTSASDHDSGVSVQHTFSATDAREANTHVNDTTGDPHPQYLTPAEATAAYLSKAGVTTAKIVTSETSTATSFSDLATVGPTVTVTTGTRALVFISANAENTANFFASVGCAVSGATTRAATFDECLQFNAVSTQFLLQASRAVVVEGLTAGSNTFTLKYYVSGGTGTFRRRELTVIPL